VFKLLLVLAWMLPMVAHAKQPVELKAEVLGFAALPADTFQMPPKDAPAYFQTSGRYANPPYEKLKAGAKDNAISFLSTGINPRPTGWKLPLSGQPIQGFSGVVAIDKNNFWVIVDNGFGFKNNSHDALLKIHQVRIDWVRSELTVTQTIFIHDRNHVVPFPIALETDPSRYLTGADFDPESLQVTATGFYLGDEFGPYLLHVAKDGALLAVHDLKINNQHYFSVDHPSKPTPSKPDGAPTAAIARSRGFEGMAASPDQKYLYPLLEGPIYNVHKEKWEGHQGKNSLTIFQFDTAQQQFTTRRWRYVLENKKHNIGDFNFMNDRYAWVIERDNREGDPFKRCAKRPRSNCFDAPADFKRLYLVDLNPSNKTQNEARKLAYVDLMNIADKSNKSGHAHRGVFNMPFFTIESVDAIAKDQVVVGNDNNLPFSSGRTPMKNDDNEFVWLKIKGLHTVLK